jgi:hypothetical protein
METIYRSASLSDFESFLRDFVLALKGVVPSPAWPMIERRLENLVKLKRGDLSMSSPIKPRNYYFVDNPDRIAWEEEGIDTAPARLLEFSKP